MKYIKKSRNPGGLLDFLMYFILLLLKKYC
jgi:hypothetical protein